MKVWLPPWATLTEPEGEIVPPVPAKAPIVYVVAPDWVTVNTFFANVELAVLVSGVVFADTE